MELEKEKNTNFKAGVEWWDKVFQFKTDVSIKQLYLISQARDKSIHVFGSDWLGELRINLEEFCDGQVHQKWFKLGNGRRHHNRVPRGYIHLAFEYREYNDGSRPFSKLPVERIQTFEEYLAVSDTDTWSEDHRVLPYREEPRTKSSSSLVKSAPQNSSNKSSKSMPKSKSSSAIKSNTQNSSSMKGSNQDVESISKRSRRKSNSNLDSSSESETEENSQPSTTFGTLIDLSFDNQSSIQPSPLRTSRSTMIDINPDSSDTVDFIEKNSNPFLAMHNNWAPPPSNSILV